MKISLLFAWYDLWIGLFWDAKNKWLYILPFPTVGIILKFKWKSEDEWKDWCVDKCRETKGFEGTQHEGVFLCEDGCVFAKRKSKGWLK